MARAPAEITLGDVLRAVEGPMLEAPAPGNAGGPPELGRAWRRLQAALEGAAEAITFQQLVDEGPEKARMYYI